MAGALICGLVCRDTGRISIPCLAEVIGTGIIDGMLAYPVAAFVLENEAVLFTFMISFLVSTACSSFAVAILVHVFERSRVLAYMKEMLANME